MRCGLWVVGSCARYSSRCCLSLFVQSPFGGNAEAAACPAAPLANGTTADAAQVMTWFDCKAPLDSPALSGNVILSSGPGPSLQLARTGAGNAGILITGSVITTIQASHDGTTWADAISIGANNGGGGVSDGYVGIGLAGGFPQNPFQVGASAFVVTSSGNVGIGSSSPVQALEVNGTIRQSACVNMPLSANASGDIVCTVSDSRRKNVLGHFKGGLDEISHMTPITFTYKPTTKDARETFIHAGFVAQEVRAVIPEASAMQRDGYYSIDTTAILAASVNALKELKAESDSQKLEIAQLRREVAELQKRIVKGKAISEQ